MKKTKPARCSAGRLESLFQKCFGDSCDIVGTQTVLAQNLSCGAGTAKFIIHANPLNRSRQLFGKHFGTSPLKYRNMLRIRRAKQLLEDGNCTVTEAAYDSGFENIGYFCECYKKITGETPKQTKQRFE